MPQIPCKYIPSASNDCRVVLEATRTPTGENERLRFPTENIYLTPRSEKEAPDEYGFIDGFLTIINVDQQNIHNGRIRVTLPSHFGLDRNSVWIPKEDLHRFPNS